MPVSEGCRHFRARAQSGDVGGGMEVPSVSDPEGGLQMKKLLLLGTAFAALALAVPAQAAELKFKPGEESKFNWANYEDLKKVDLKGETLTVFGPWRGPDETQFQSV